MDRLFWEGVRPLRLEDAVFASMLDGWKRQQRSRMLRPATISAGVTKLLFTPNSACAVTSPTFTAPCMEAGGMAYRYSVFSRK